MADISKIQLSDNTEYNLKDAQVRSALSVNDESTGDISKIQLSDNTQYNIKDAVARQDIETVTTDVKAQVNADKDLINGGDNFIDDETVDDYDDKIAEMQEAYKKFIPIQTTSGTEIQLDNTNNDKVLVNIGLDGNTEQTTYTGKNFLQISASTQTINQVKFTINSDGTVTANGQASSNATLVLNSGRTWFTATGEFILTGCPSGGSASTYFIRYGGSSTGDDLGSGKTFTENDSNAYRYVQITIASGYNCNNLVFKPMARLSSVSDASFEPYTGRNCLTKSIIPTRSKSSYWRE